MVESFFATLECALLAPRHFRTHGEARVVVFEWRDVFYNRQRRHSALGYWARWRQLFTNNWSSRQRLMSYEVNGPRNWGHSRSA